MEASEVLAFLPLLIYGIAIAELFSQWKRFINFKRLDLPPCIINHSTYRNSTIQCVFIFTIGQ